MILKYLNTRIRLNALTRPASLKCRSLLHTSQFVYGEDEGKTADGSNDADKSKSTSRKKQALKAKFGKLDFISFDPSAQPLAKPAPVNLKPEIDYQSFVKPKSKTDKEKEVFVPTAKVKVQFDKRLERTKIIADRMENNYSEETLLKVAGLIDKKNTAETAKTLLEPLKKQTDDDLLEDSKEDDEPKVFNNHLKFLLNEIKQTDLNTPKIEQTDSNGLILTEEEFKLKKQTRGFRGSPYQQFQSLKSGNGLSIFTELKPQTSQLTQESPIWSMHSDEELKSAQEIPHLNGFDEMIKLTDEGKLWKFPIDNQQGMEQQEDARTPFHEHIFLEHHLERFPDIEPIQQFMSLAINGLSQNGFISLKEKVEIIDWYRNYFNEKIDLINEALQAEIKEREFKESLRKGAS